MFPVLSTRRMSSVHRAIERDTCHGSIDWQSIGIADSALPCLCQYSAGNSSQILWGQTCLTRVELCITFDLREPPICWVLWVSAVFCRGAGGLASASGISADMQVPVRHPRLGHLALGMAGNGGKHASSAYTPVASFASPQAPVTAQRRTPHF